MNVYESFKMFALYPDTPSLGRLLARAYERVLLLLATGGS